jgi:hypothetical protein
MRCVHTQQKIAFFVKHFATRRPQATWKTSIAGLSQAAFCARLES